MALHSGDRLGPYEIIGAIGSGGMGDVYRARDTHLDRTVAVKVLPDTLRSDTERLERFEREAKTLASLNHPNIAQIYGFEAGALAMEFVEGEDLSVLIGRGPVPVDEALDIADQVALALEAAHEAGIVHRDLKPSNIRLRQDGIVKVLDFGIAKALAPPGSLLEESAAPTMTSPAMTHQGTILGTAAYMAPEQARGRAVDKRADIWAFGVLIYELTTGQRPFGPGSGAHAAAETVPEVLAAVIKSEPDWTVVPAPVARLVRSCLEKDPKKRLRDIGDWRRQVDAPTPAMPFDRGGRRPWLPWAIAALMALAAAAMAVGGVRQSAPPPQPVTFEILPPADHLFDLYLAVSPDGQRVAFTARDADGVSRVWVREFGAVEARPIAGTEGASGVFWSADGQMVGFVVGGALRRVPVSGGAAMTLHEAASGNEVGSAAWNHDDVLIFGGTRSGAIRRVSASGGDVSPVTTLDTSRAEIVHGLPSFLPDGRHFLYFRLSLTPGLSGLFVGSIDRPSDQQDLVRLLDTSHARYWQSSDGAGHLLYLRDGILVAHPFDAERLRLEGDARPVVAGVGNSGGLGFFATGGGTIVYRSGPRVGAGLVSQLTWVDRQGRPQGVVGDPGPYDWLALAPDGTRASVVLASPAPDGGLGNIDVWVLDLDRGVPSRITTSPAIDRGPIWSPTGDRLAFRSERDGVRGLFVAPSTLASGGELLVATESYTEPMSWSRDGRFLLYSEVSSAAARDVWMVRLEDASSAAPLLQTPFDEGEARFSPDMRWIAFTSNLSGRDEVYVVPFDAAAAGVATGAAVPISKDGGRQPRWVRDGRQLVFQAPDGSLNAVSLTIDGGVLQPGTPEPLFTPRGALWDVTADGERFLTTVPPREAGLTPITVLLHWR